MSGSRRSNPVKVVIINTEYIKTDAMSFKSVVQHLTGKDSTVSTFSENYKFSWGGGEAGGAGGGGGDGGRRVGGMSTPVLNKGMSFRDLDNLLLELPNIDDIYQFCLD